MLYLHFVEVLISDTSQYNPCIHMDYILFVLINNLILLVLPNLKFVLTKLYAAIRISKYEVVLVLYSKFSSTSMLQKNKSKL